MAPNKQSFENCSQAVSQFTVHGSSDFQSSVMKIGYLMQSGVPDVRQQPLSGPANHVKHVFEHLQKLGHELVLLAYLDKHLWKSEDLVTFKKVGADKFELKAPRLVESLIRRIQSTFRLPYFALFESIRFANACRNELADCDLFYERMGWMGYGGALASRWLRIPLVLELNGDHLDELHSLSIAPTGSQRWVSLWLMRFAARKARHSVAAGEGWRQRFIERWQVSPDKVTTIENGSEIVECLSRSQLRAFSEDTASPEVPVIVYVGAFEPWHGVEILVNAVAEVIDQGGDLQLILIGSGTQCSRISDLVHKRAIEDSVTMTGHISVERMAMHLANADIAVSPYCGRAEYSGLKLLDYKAAGLPTIASGENNQPTSIRHGQTGIIVPPCDVTHLSQAISQLIHDRDLRREMGRKARLEAEKYHSWHGVAEQLDGLFARLTT